MIKQLVATIRYNAVYTCIDCGRQVTGTTAGTTIHAASPDELKRQIDNIEQSPKDMPYGWASYPDRKYRCSNCKGR